MTEREKLDDLAWELFQGMGTIALGLGETVQRQAARDVLNAALETAGYEVAPRNPTATATTPAFDFPDLGTGDAQ